MFRFVKENTAYSSVCVLGAGAWMLAVRGCRGVVCKERPAAAHGRHSQFQMDSVGSETDSLISQS